MIEYVLIDLDGTIFDFNKSEKEAFKKTIYYFNNYIVNDDEANQFSIFNEYFFNKFHNKEMTREEFHYNRFFEIYKYLGLKNNIFEANKYFIETLKYQADLYDDSIESLIYLKNKYKLYVISNGMKEVQIQRLKTSNIYDYFSNFYISSDVGYNKPDKLFFDYVLHDIGDLDNFKYIIIGDRIDSDISGGINSKIKTIYINRLNCKINEKIYDYEIDTLKKLPSIL